MNTFEDQVQRLDGLVPEHNCGRKTKVQFPLSADSQTIVDDGSGLIVWGVLVYFKQVSHNSWRIGLEHCCARFVGASRRLGTKDFVATGETLKLVELHEVAVRT